MLGHSWTSPIDWYIADLRDLAAAHLTAFINANRGEGTPQIESPAPVPRPGDADRESAAAAEEKAYRASHDRIRRMVLPGR